VPPHPVTEPLARVLPLALPCSKTTTIVLPLLVMNGLVILVAVTAVPVSQCVTCESVAHAPATGVGVGVGVAVAVWVEVGVGV
jgi:hypothetical protein